jgi:hypothetical protein
MSQVNLMESLSALSGKICCASRSDDDEEKSEKIVIPSQQSFIGLKLFNILPGNIKIH